MVLGWRLRVNVAVCRSDIDGVSSPHRLVPAIRGPAMRARDRRLPRPVERYDPRLRFRTISTPRFDIHFHQGEEAMAQRLAALAEHVAIELEPDSAPAGARAT